MKFNRILTGTLFASSLLAGSAYAGMTNAGFESGDLTGWTSFGQVSVESVFTVENELGGSTTVTAKSGNYMAMLTNLNTAPSFLFQSMPQGSGVAMTLWYRYIATDYAPYNDQLTVSVKNTNSALANVDVIGVVSGTTVVGSYGDSGWKSFNLSDSTQLVKFFAQNQQDALQPGYAFVDIAPVPEPESYAMFLAGLGIMGAVARRRSKKA